MTILLKKHLYRDRLHLNRIGFTILADNFLIKSGETDFLIIRFEIKA